MCGQRLTSLIPRVFSYGVVNRHLTESQADLLTREINDYYLQEERPTYEQTIEHVQRTCRNKGVKLIGRSSIIEAIQQLSSAEIVEKRLGHKAMREILKRHRGRAPIGDHPLGLVEIDHTQVDVFVVLPSGKAYRPWITVAIDTYSRMVLGFYLTMDPPSQLSVGLCLYRAMSPKTEWLRQHGITSPWPCHGRWHGLIADNAMEFRGYFLQEVALEHGIHVSFRGIGNPNWGAHIERLMGRVADEMHALKGTSFSNPIEKGDYESAGRAVLTLEQLEAVFLHFFVEVYHHSAHGGLGGRSPISVWRDYFANSGGEVHYPQVEAGQSFLLSLLPTFRRTIQQDGVTWEGNRYSDEILSTYIREQNPKRADGLWRFHYDPRDIRLVWWKDPASSIWFPIPLRDTDGQGVALWELKDHQAVDRQIAAATIDQPTADQGRNAVDDILQAGTPIPLKEHRKRRERAKQAPAEPVPMEPSATPNTGLPAPSPTATSLAALGWSPVEQVDPTVFTDPGSFEVETLHSPRSFQQEV